MKELVILFLLCYFYKANIIEFPDPMVQENLNV